MSVPSLRVENAVDVILVPFVLALIVSWRERSIKRIAYIGLVRIGQQKRGHRSLYFNPHAF
jgi:hypothetical protein